MELFNVSKDIEEFGRFKEEIVRILQFLLDESAEVCYIILQMQRIFVRYYDNVFSKTRIKSFE